MNKLLKNYFFLFSLLFLFAQCASLKNANSGTFKDKRDGQTYEWLRMSDNKKWMVQNLNFEVPDSWCYNEEENNCYKNGRLYTWDAAVKACPKGWRLPTDDEWWAMTSLYGMARNWKNGQVINKKNRGTGKAAYNTLLAGGSSGFNGQLSGHRAVNGKFIYLEEDGRYWSNSDMAWSYTFNNYSKTLFRLNYKGGKVFGFSCRCLQD